MSSKTKTNTKRIDKPGAPEDPLFYIVSPNNLQAQALQACLASELGIASTCHKDLPMNAVLDETGGRRCLYLLDCMMADQSAIEKCFDTGGAPVPDHVMITLFNVEAEAPLARMVKRHRIRGIFFRDVTQTVFIKGISTILDGHLWLTRKMLSTCVLMSNEALDEPSGRALTTLSRREKEMLQHVVFGESNQEIADAMNISLHTVKTHLYNAYKKINVSNRLQATLWAATYLRDHSDS